MAGNFGRAQRRLPSKQKLDQLAERLRTAEQVTITGYADRLGSEQANQKISEARAAAVKAYLEKSADARNIKTAGKGKSEPVTGASCARMGPEQNSNRKLIQCLQPDRRVEIEIFGPRTAAAGGDTSSAGAGARKVSDR